MCEGMCGACVMHMHSHTCHFFHTYTRSVKAELFPALKYFGLSFYAYNPVSGPTP